MKFGNIGLYELAKKVPETSEHFWVVTWLRKSGLTGPFEWVTPLLKKETHVKSLSAISQKYGQKIPDFSSDAQ